MKVCVYGLWHLGSVVASCLAEAGIDVVGVDEAATVASLQQGKALLHEPGLDNLISAGLRSGRLSFSAEPAAAMAGAAVVWVAFDTPVDDDDTADVDFVTDRVRAVFPYLGDGTTLLISSQLPVGSTRRLEQAFVIEADERRVGFAYSPENLRLGRALELFRSADRIVVGIRDEATKSELVPLLSPFTDNLVWMSVESAEMVKHALNAFLATSVTLTNEVAALCEATGADAREVEAALRLEPRIGPNAYVTAGAAFAGGTLARDVSFLNQLAIAHDLATPLLASVLPSNEAHRQWVKRKLSGRFGDLRGKTIAVLGLAYKPGTDALRRSQAVDLCRWLIDQGATVRAHDPAVKALPAELSGAVSLVATATDALENADAMVVATEWPEYKELNVEVIVAIMTEAIVIDPSRCLPEAIVCDRRVRYMTTGRSE